MSDAYPKKSGSPPEQVNHPKHYGGDVFYEVIKVLEAWLTPEQFIGFCRGNSMKYLARAGRKGENYEQDLAKALWYTEYEKGYRKRLASGMIGEGRYTVTEKEPKPKGT